MRFAATESDEWEGEQMRAITCELCGSNELIKSDGVFVCQHCGTKYTTEEARKLMVEASVTIQGAVRVDGIATGDSLLLRAKEFEAQGDIDAAEAYYNKVLDLEPGNADAREGIARVERHVVGPNLIVDFSSGNPGSAIAVFVDGKRIGNLAGGSVKSYTLPYGEHTVGAAGGIRKCKNPATVMIKRNARYSMAVGFKGLSVVFRVTRQ